MVRCSCSSWNPVFYIKQSDNSVFNASTSTNNTSSSYVFLESRLDQSTSAYPRTKELLDHLVPVENHFVKSTSYFRSIYIQIIVKYTNQRNIRKDFISLGAEEFGIWRFRHRVSSVSFVTFDIITNVVRICLLFGFSTATSMLRSRSRWIRPRCWSRRHYFRMIYLVLYYIKTSRLSLGTDLEYIYI